MSGQTELGGESGLSLAAEAAKKSGNTQFSGIDHFHVVLVLGIAVFCFFLGCSDGDRSIETRRKFAVQYNKDQLASSKNEVRTKWSKDILSVLLSIDNKAIKKPTVASAHLGKGKDRTYSLFAFWIESYPTVDGVELRLSSQSTPVIIPISEIELKQNQSAAKDTVVFGSECQWDDTSELYKSLEEITSAKEMKVRLLRTKAPVTDWFSVDFHEAEK